MALAAEIEVLTLFVDDLARARTFYGNVFNPKVVFEDDMSSVLDFGGLLVNLLVSPQALELLEPASAAPAARGASILLTVRVEDVDAACRDLRGKGVKLINGPQDRPWGRRTAAFADPSGHIWEVAQILD